MLHCSLDIRKIDKRQDLLRHMAHGYHTVRYLLPYSTLILRQTHLVQIQSSDERWAHRDPFSGSILFEYFSRFIIVNESWLRKPLRTGRYRSEEFLGGRFVPPDVPVRQTTKCPPLSESCLQATSV